MILFSTLPPCRPFSHAWDCRYGRLDLCARKRSLGRLRRVGTGRYQRAGTGEQHGLDGQPARRKTEDVGITRPVVCLDRLSVVRGDDFQAVYDSVVGNYRDFRRWGTDLGTLRELAELAGSSEEISNALRFIRDARVSPVSQPVLSVDRQGLLACLSLSGLAESRRRNLDVLMREAAGFKLRYLDAYQTHHESPRNQLPV